MRWFRRAKQSEAPAAALPEPELLRSRLQVACELPALADARGLLERLADDYARTRALAERPLRIALVHLGQRPLVFVREYLHELHPRLGPVVQQFAGAAAAGPAVVVFQQFLQQRLVRLVAVQLGGAGGGLLFRGAAHALPASVR